MAFDFKKEYKEFYMPKNKPEIVNVPATNYIAVRGKGNPNTPDGEYQQAIGVLYAVAYTIIDFDSLTDPNEYLLRRCMKRMYKAYRREQQKLRKRKKDVEVEYII